MHPNFYVIAGVLKSDMVETERHLDMLDIGRMEVPRTCNISTKKMEQRAHLKEALRQGTISLDKYLTAMGATNLKVDSKTKEAYRQQRGLSHHRRTIDAVRDNVVCVQIGALNYQKKITNRTLIIV